VNERLRDAVPWLVLVVCLGGLVAYQPSERTPPSPRSVPRGGAKDVALPGGGTSEGSRCGSKGFHHFELPPTVGRPDTATPGPQLVLGAYGFGKRAGDDPGRFTIGLNLGPGPGGPFDLLPPLGPDGVAVEIEGPDGLVLAVHGLPVTQDDDRAHGPDGSVRVGAEGGLSVEVTIPAEALCPGYEGSAVQRKLVSPIDSHNTITGQPPYTLTVSVSDPAIGARRKAVAAPVTGDVLVADNLVPDWQPPAPKLV